MKLFSTKVIKPDIPFTDYQFLSYYENFKLRLSNNKFRPLVFHTRDYVFSTSLALEFQKPKKLYTRFNIFYLHCGILYQQLAENDQNLFNHEINRFNKH